LLTEKTSHYYCQRCLGNPDPTDFTFHNDFETATMPHSCLMKTPMEHCQFYFKVLPGSYSVSEEPISGWQSPESTFCTNGETIESIDVAAGETVTCTFVNEELAKIILVKNTIGGNGDFTFNMTGDGLPASTQLTTVNGTTNQTFEDLDQDNTYSVSEVVPAGWNLTGSSCTGNNTPASITPEAGETVTCTFTNTQRGHIIVDKITDPAGDLQSFNFTATGSGYTNFSLADLSDPNNQELVPGTYGVSETVPTGWDLTSATCVSSLGDQETPASLELDAGETITCTFNNT
jgi:hypothetical protein